MACHRSSILPNYPRAPAIIYLFLGLGFVYCLKPVECSSQHRKSGHLEYPSTNCRAHSVSLTDFGGIGDGVTLNTKAFHASIDHLSEFSSEGGGGGQLFVPPGKWLTGSFNLTSHFTLYLHKDAEILGSQDEADWPLIAPLPSYGRGRDEPGGRYSSLIMGSNLTDVVITGDNGTINGQGRIWWDKFKNKQLKYTRGYLIELMFSDQIVISHITLVDSPSWNVHPVYSRPFIGLDDTFLHDKYGGVSFLHSNIIVKGITILAPLESPNTDGINPDSCSNVRIEDSFVVSGDDCIAIKSGWDQYGITFGMPTEHVIIRRFTCISPTSAVIALGSEMSGGIQDVRAEEIYAVNSESGVRIKTAPGRGGFVKDIYVKGMSMVTMKWVFWMTGNYGQHPDNNTDLNAMPVVKSISYTDVIADNVTMAAELDGIPNAPFTDICLSNVTVGIIQSKKPIWNCTYVQGVSGDVSPRPCDLLPDQGSAANLCPYPANKLPIEDVEFKICCYKSIHL